MTAEEIIYALAQSPPPIEGLRYYCLLCQETGGDLDRPEHHKSDCAWRMAREWVRINRV